MHKLPSNPCTETKITAMAMTKMDAKNMLPGSVINQPVRLAGG
jgi:hypothetical protein